MTLKKRKALAPDATQAFRELVRNEPGSIVHLLKPPFIKDGLVIPGLLRNSLDHFISAARERKQLREQEKAREAFQQARGMTGLFIGQPGTGKTIAAQVIASELGLDLYRIDLSSIVSKYAGETSKNL
jgi:MoxR-like ATPase